MQRQHGFTLIEIMVVVTIVALMISFGYVGFNQLLGKRNSEDVQSLLYWLQSAGDRAQLEGAVYGIRLEAQGMSFLTYRQGIWLRVLDQPPWVQESEFQLSFEGDESDQRSMEITGGDTELLPTLVFLPDGTQWPPGRIRVETQSGVGWIAANDQGRFAWSEQ